jgi:hypothetical protein
LLKQHEGVVVATVASEVTASIADKLGLLLVRQPGREEVRDIRDLESKQVDVEVARLVHLDDIEAEVAKAPDLEWPVQQNAAYVVLCVYGGYHGIVPFRLGLIESKSGITIGAEERTLSSVADRLRS